MNVTEKKMFDILLSLKDSGAIAVKAEFEAEGTRLEELLRLIDIARKANFKLALKIGGCEAIKDLMDSKQLGVDFIIAPMIESRYALSKFVDAKNKIFSDYEQDQVNFLFNIETKLGFDNLSSMNDFANKSCNISGIVFGRVDFCGSLGLSRDDINSEQILNYCKSSSNFCKDNGIDFVVGGGISSLSIDFLSDINKTHLSRFETRKIIFLGRSIESNKIKESLLDAVHFELLWLKNKQNYYSKITNEDQKRINMLEERWGNFES